MKILAVVAVIGLALTGCATTRPPLSPLVYEDPNIAIYRICESQMTIWGLVPLRCHQQVVQKNKTDNINANVNLKTEPPVASKPSPH